MEEASSLHFFGRFLACRSDCPVAGKLRRDFDLATSHDSFKSRSTLEVHGRQHIYFSLKQAEAHGLDNAALLPFSLKVLLENLLRHEDGRSVSADDIRAMALWVTERRSDREIAFRPARVLMQDFTGVPAVVDLAAMRDAMSALGGDPRHINPLARVDLVIDHSVMVDAFGTGAAFNFNVDKEYERNGERYAFLRWGASAFDNFRVVPPGTGICHQVNLEYLARTVWSEEDADSGETHRLSGHAGRHRQPHDDGQRTRACWAGAWAASRRRRRCSASRSPC